jgi:hypothetical protein
MLQAENYDEEDQELFVASCICGTEETHVVSFGGNLFYHKNFRWTRLHSILFFSLSTL